MDPLVGDVAAADALISAGRVGRAHGLDGSFHVTQPRSRVLALGATVTLDGVEREIAARRSSPEELESLQLMLRALEQMNGSVVLGFSGEDQLLGMLVLRDESGRASALAADVQRGLEELGVYRREERPWLPHVTVPNVVELTQAAASSAITAASLTVGTITTASSLTVPAGSVISQHPAAGAEPALQVA